MPAVPCPHVGCDYTTADLDAAIVAAQLHIHGMSHNNAATGLNIKKPDRPEVKTDMMESEWSEFEFEWGNYKRNAKIIGKDENIRQELQQCCTKSVRTRLFQSKGHELNTISEANLLEAIKSACVNKITKESHRNQFFNLAQMPGEAPQNYVSRIRGKGALCHFVVKYNCSEGCAQDKEIEISYVEDAVENQLVAGVANPDHKHRLLTEKHETLAEKLALLDTLHMNDMSSAADAKTDQRSEYSKNKNANQSEKKCSCGKQIMSSNKTHILCKDCFEKTKTGKCSCGKNIVPSRTQCFKCAKKEKPVGESKSHTAETEDTLMFVLSVDSTNSEENAIVDEKGNVVGYLRKSDIWETDEEVVDEEGKFVGYMGKRSSSEESDDSSTSKESWESVSEGTEERKNQRSWARRQARTKINLNMSSTSEEAIYFPHSSWNGTKFVPSAPMQHPKINAKISPMREAMESWKLEKGLIGSIKALTKQNDVKRISEKFEGIVDPSLVDTGAQLCSITKKSAARLGFTKEDLLPTEMKIRGASGKFLNLEGCLLAKIQFGNATSYQVMYVVDTPSGSVLSREALMDLGLISRSFPYNTNTADNVMLEQEECNCKTREKAPDLPASLPFEPIEANREKFEDWMKDFFSTSAFLNCKHKPLPELSGEKMKIHFREGATPEPAYTPAMVPYHYKEEAKALLDMDERLGVIRKVPEGTPTTWCSRMVMQVKKSGKLRRTIDLQKVNKATFRETHFTHSPHQLVCDIPKDQYKARLDCWNSYHSVALDEETSHATTFVTEWGTYECLRAPQGFHASGDHYTRRKGEITKDINNKKEIVDDTLLFEKTIEALFWLTMKYIKRCSDNGIVFNPDKFVFGHKDMEFAGFEITADGYRPTKRMLEAIANFPQPKNITDIRAFFGLVEQVSFAFSKSEVMAPFRDLLKTKSQFYWDERLNNLFIEARKHIVEKVINGVKSFEIGRETALTTDYSKVGVGYFLQQKYCECDELSPICGPGHWRLVTAGSRFIKDHEKRYSPVEGEALAMAYGLNSLKMYCLGNPKLIIGVDHRPLLSIMGDKPMDQIQNPRLLAFKRKCVAFKYNMVHVPGKKHVGPDTTSRYPGGEGDERDILVDDEGYEIETSRAYFLKNKNLIGDTVDIMAMILDTGGEDSGYESDESDEEVENIAKITVQMSLKSFETIRWDDMIRECAMDEETREIIRSIRSGFPEKRDEASEIIKRVWHFRDELYEVEGIPMLNRRMYVPRKLRNDVMESLHSAHQGTTAMKSSARARFWYPGMDAAIVQVRDRCRKCNEGAPSQAAEEWLEEPAPTFPFERICCDYFEIKGSHYFAQADRYSGWLSIAKMKSTAFSELAPVLRKSFSWHGVPDCIETDGGPPFNGMEFKNFCAKWKIRHRLCSAGYPQSNGRAELAVKSAKRLIGDSTDADGTLNTDAVVTGILQYKNTPLRGCNESPAEIIFGHSIQDNLPRAPHEGWRRLNNAREEGMARLKVNRKEDYNESKRNLDPLQAGEVVLVQNMTGPHPLRWSRTGVIIENVGCRQYYVKMDGSRRLLLRNRKNLRPIKPIQEDDGVKSKSPHYGGLRNAPFPTETKKTSPRFENEAPEAPAPVHHENDDTPRREAQPSQRRILPLSKGTTYQSPGINTPATPLRPSPNLGQFPTPQTGSSSPYRPSPTMPYSPVTPYTPYLTPSNPESSPQRRSPSPQGSDRSNPRTPDGTPSRARQEEQPAQGKRIRKKPARFNDYVEWDE